MKIRIVSLVALLATPPALMACNKAASGAEITMSKQPVFVKGAPSPLEIQIREGNQPGTGYAVKTEFNMSRMDHGTMSATLKETSPGIYSGAVPLPMGGEWDVDVTATKDGKTIQKALTVQLNDGG